MRQIYAKHKIRQRPIKPRQKFTAKQISNYQQWLQEIKTTLERAKAENRKLVFVDEITFSFKTRRDLAYSGKNENI